MKKLLQRREKKVLEMLAAAGYEAYFVGGCVRDVLRWDMDTVCGDGLIPKDADWKEGDVDVATNALPWQVKEVFSSWRMVETGLRHGTLTVVLPGMPEVSEGKEKGCLPEDTVSGIGEGGKAASVAVEVTTFRSDGDYSDSRHPDKVAFVASIEEDLARRDFTINAMACDLAGNLIDPFGGQEDLRKKRIRAVGDPEMRFQEDALRIMRALRFASVLGFFIEEETARALLHQKEGLRNIAAERVFSELKKLVTGKNAGAVVRDHVDVLGVVLPELSAMKGFEQHNPYHKYDVLEHCVRAMEQVRTTPENQVYMKLAALFHDIGKPLTFTMDEKGVGHFYGHPAKSEEVAREVLGRLKADGVTLERVALLVKRHDLLFERDEGLLKKWMNRLTPEVLFEILEIKRADNLATGNMSAALLEKFDGIRVMTDEILAQEQCFSLKELAVNGSDLLALGMKPGPAVGAALADLLEAVITGRCENERETLLEMVRALIK